MSITGTQLAFVPPAPPTNGTPTSNAAAERIEPMTGTLRRKMLDYLRTCGDAGATDEQIQFACSINANTERPRRQELEKMGFIRRMDRFTRPTRSGRSAVIFIAMEAQ